MAHVALAASHNGQLCPGAKAEAKILGTGAATKGDQGKTPALNQKIQSTYMVQSMVSVVVTSLMVWVSIPHMGT